MNNQRVRILSSQEEADLFDALDGNELVKNIVIIALNTGLRRGEIFNLKWFDLDLGRGLILVRESKSNKKRLVPMNSTVQSLFDGLSRRSEYVFPSPKTGTRLNQIKRSFRTAVNQARIEDFCFHDLRHTFATRIAEFTDPFSLMRILGHSDLRMTARYTHATDAALRRAVENLEDQNSCFGNELVTKQKGQAQGSS